MTNKASIALAWILIDKRITSVLIVAGSTEQLNDNLKAAEKPELFRRRTEKIEEILA